MLTGERVGAKDIGRTSPAVTGLAVPYVLHDHADRSRGCRFGQRFCRQKRTVLAPTLTKPSVGLGDRPSRLSDRVLAVIAPHSSQIRLAAAVSRPTSKSPEQMIPRRRRSSAGAAHYPQELSR